MSSVSGREEMNELPILKTTEMLTVRQSEGRQVFTYQDLAEGFAVSPVRLRNQYSRNIDAWSADETDVYQNGTPSGTQETRYFTARGAMRFCRYIKSGRSDELYNHLLDLWEQERGAVIAPAPADQSAFNNSILASLAQTMAMLGGTALDAKDIATATVARVDDVEAKLLTETQAREAYEAEHHLDRVQQYVRSFTDVKIQVVSEQLKRDPSANARQLYSRFTNEMKILANVATSKAGELSVSGAKRCLVAAQTLAKRYGVPVVVQMPIATEAAQ
jgi:hypothetical protein